MDCPILQSKNWPSSHLCLFFFSLSFHRYHLGWRKKNFYSFIAPTKGPFLTPLPSLWEGEFSIMRCLAPLEPTNCCLPLFFPLFSPLFPHNFARKIAD